MATTTSRLQLVIAGDNKGAIKSIDGTEKAVGGLQSKLGGLGAGLAGAFSVGAVVAFGKASVSAYSDIAGQVAAIKRVTGESAEDSSLLAFAAQQSGIDATKAAVGWRTLAKNIDSGKVAAEGIATKDQQGNLLTYDEILGNVADKVASLPPGFQRTALAQRLFGKSGADMVKILAGGRKGIEDLRKEMQSYGLEFSDSGLKKYQEFVQAQRDMKASLMGVEVAVAEKVAPAITTFNNLVAHVPGPVKLGAVAFGALTASVVGLNLAYGVLQPLWDRGLISTIRNTAATAEATSATTLRAAADTAAAEAAAAEATATEALAAALGAAGSGEAEMAAATSARAAATEAAAAASAADAIALEAESAEAAAGSLVTLGSAGGLAAGGAAVLGLAFLDAAGKSQRLSQNVSSLQQQLEQGVDPQDIFKKQLAATLSGSDGGFKLDIQGDTFRKAIDDLGLSAKEFDDLLTGSDKNWQAFIKEVTDSGLGPILIPQLESLRNAGKKAVANQEDQNRIGKELGVTTDDLAGSTADLTGETKDLRTATEKLNDATQEALDKQGKLTDARQAHTDAEADLVRANYELQVARQEAAGNSDEYRQAEEKVTEALAAVPEAQKKVTDAQHDLNDARKDAAQRLRDMVQAERDAALAQQDAALKVKEAENERRRVNADPKSSALDKERAALAVAEAQNDATKATGDAAKAAADNADAQRKGIEGDAEVVRAKQAVSDANDGVRDAVRGVRDAESDAAKVITAAKAKVLEAQQKATDAAIGEADAWGAVVTQQYGAVAGAQALRDKYDEIRKDLDPNSPLYQRITQLMRDLTSAISIGMTSGLGPGIPPARDPDSRGPNQPGDRALAGPKSGPAGDARSSGPTQNITQVNNNTFLGTPRSVRIAGEQAAERHLNRLAGRLR